MKKFWFLLRIVLVLSALAWAFIYLFPREFQIIKSELSDRWGVTESTVHKEIQQSGDIKNASLNEVAHLFEDPEFFSCIKRTEKNSLTGIEELRCENSRIQSIAGLKHLSELKFLYLSQNALTAVDLSDNIRLNVIDLSQNHLKEIDLRRLPNLYRIQLDDNKLKSLRLSNNIHLRKLSASHNLIDDFVIESAGVKLKAIDLSHNQLKHFDLTGWFNFNLIDLRYNQISDVSGVKPYNASSITYPPADDEADRIIRLSHNPLQKTNIQTMVDAGLKVAALTPGVDVFPDATFRECLEISIASSFDALERLLCSSVLGSENAVYGKYIGNIEGIQHLTQLTHLDLSHQRLTEADLSTLTRLVSVNLSHNLPLKTLKLPDSMLHTLILSGRNELTSLDLSVQKSLKTLLLDGNPLFQLKLSGIEQVEQFSVDESAYLNAQSKQEIWQLIRRSMPEAYQIFKDSNLADCVSRRILETALEASKIKTLKCHLQIKDLTGLQSLTALEKLNLMSVEVEEFNLKFVQSLEELVIDQSRFDVLNLSANNQLRNIQIENSHLGDVLFPNLKSNTGKGMIAELKNNSLRSMEFGQRCLFDKLLLSRNTIRQFTPVQTCHFKQLDMFSNRLNALDISSLFVEKLRFHDQILNGKVVDAPPNKPKPFGHMYPSSEIESH